MQEDDLIYNFYENGFKLQRLQKEVNAINKEDLKNKLNELKEEEKKVNSIIKVDLPNKQREIMDLEEFIKNQENSYNYQERRRQYHHNQYHSGPRSRRSYVYNNYLVPIYNLKNRLKYEIDTGKKTLIEKEKEKMLLEKNFSRLKDIEYKIKQQEKMIDLANSKYSLLDEYKSDQKRLFIGDSKEGFNNHGFKKSEDFNKNGNVINEVKEHQLKPMKKIANDFSNTLNEINNNYNNIDDNIKKITNEKNTGLRDVIKRKYPSSYLGSINTNSETVTDARLKDIKQMEEYNRSIKNLGIITACTLLVASIMIARD